MTNKRELAAGPKPEFKHGDDIIVRIGETAYRARIEERYMFESPNKKMALYVVWTDQVRFPWLLSSVQDTPGITIERAHDEDGHCSRCGLDYFDRNSFGDKSEEPHVCPPGFTS